jgi:hypothetical protein
LAEGADAMSMFGEKFAEMLESFTATDEEGGLLTIFDSE